MKLLQLGFTAFVAFCVLSASSHAQTASKLRFVVLGHLRGDRNGELLAILPEVIDCVRKDQPDLVFLLGDLIWGDVRRTGPGMPTDPAQLLSDWEKLDAALVDMGAPIHRVPGNHDIWDVVARDIWVQRYGSLPRSITFRNSRFLLLNSAWWPADSDTHKQPQAALHGVAIGPEQIAFLRAELAPSPGVEHVFLFLHHVRWWKDNSPWWKDVAPQFRARPVRAVFSGDYGPLKFSHLEREGVHYLQTSVDSMIPVALLREREPQRLATAQLDNYVVVDIDGANVQYSVRTVGALSSGEFSPERYRAIYEYDKDSFGRKLLKRWSTPDRMIRGVALVVAVAFLAGLLSMQAWMLIRRLAAARSA